jgi:glycosyltransferase A (GT-A) superfamily protein (DUF2064 family)
MGNALLEAVQLAIAHESGPSAQYRCAIAVMAKASIAGTTKTRLVPPLTFEEAALLNTQFLRDAADNILTAANSAPISGWMAYAPAGAEEFFRSNLPASIGLIETVATIVIDMLSRRLRKALRVSTLPTRLADAPVR